jgi:hypothetical protein
LANKGDTAEKKQKKTEAKVSSPTKKKWPRSRAKSNKAGRGFDVGMNLTLEGQMMSGQKRKSVQVYRQKGAPMIEALEQPLAMVVHVGGPAPMAVENVDVGTKSNDSNKGRSESNRSSDQAEAVEQPR